MSKLGGKVNLTNTEVTGVGEHSPVAACMLSAALESPSPTSTLEAIPGLASAEGSQGVSAGPDKRTALK